MTEEQAYLVWLKSIPYVTNKRMEDLLAVYGSARGVFQYFDGEACARWPGWNGELISLIQKARTENRVSSAVRIVKDKGITPYFQEQEGYPALLKEIYDPPRILFAKGDASPNLDRCMAMVGTRHSTRYGRKIAQRLAAELAEAGVTIVSGMARGIDACCHEGALQAGGFTIAVLGCGADVVYPQENTGLYQRILQSGCVVSEYFPEIQPLAGHFPARNRIISGMCHGLIVVESNVKGGSMITVRMAQEQGREVMAVPGNVDSPASGGTNRLIYEGATPVSSADDVLFAMGWQGYQNNRKAVNAVSQPAKPELSPLEQKVYALLFEGEMPFDQLCQSIEKNQAEMAACLTLMEIRGIIKQLPGRQFALAQ